MQADVLKEVNSFIYRLVEEGELNLARLLRQRLIGRIEQKALGSKVGTAHMATAQILPSPDQKTK